MTNLEKRVTGAIRELLDMPVLNALAVLFGELAPDMDAVTLGALRDDNVRLFQMIRDGLAALDDEVRRKINPEEAMELALQTHHNLGRTVQREKRALMISVCVHGIVRPDDDAAEKRLFVRAMEDLDIAHVALLKYAYESSFRGGMVLKSIQRALITELIARGFMKRTDDRVSRAERVETESKERWALYSLTVLGQRFVDYMQGTLRTRREPKEWILKNPDPLP